VVIGATREAIGALGATLGPGGTIGAVGATVVFVLTAGTGAALSLAVTAGTVIGAVACVVVGLTTGRPGNPNLQRRQPRTGKRCGAVRETCVRRFDL
jgi:hypothetical protein